MLIVAALIRGDRAAASAYALHLPPPGSDARHIAAAQAKRERRWARDRAILQRNAR